MKEQQPTNLVDLFRDAFNETVLGLHQIHAAIGCASNNLENICVAEDDPNEPQETRLALQLVLNALDSLIEKQDFYWSESIRLLSDAKDEVGAELLS